MKLNRFFIVLAMGASFVACTGSTASKDENGTEISDLSIKDFKASKGEIDSVSYLVGIQFGSFVRGNDFGKLNMSEIKKGMNDFINCELEPSDPAFAEQFKINLNEMNEIFNNYLEKRQQVAILKSKAQAEKFLSENAKKPGVQVTESGLQYRIISEGNEVRPTATSAVSVLYKGTLPDGTVFDETPEGAAPINLGLNQVIAGWTEGLQLIGEGGEIELYIPAELGYGDRAVGAIPAGSALVFNVKLISVAVEE